MKHLVYLLFIAIAFTATAQTPGYDPLHPPNTFQSPDNPYYWKNKLPHPGYWQQDVYYNIKASIDEKTDIVDCYLDMTYWNNSPDTLYEVFFHLYQNAFQPGSYYDNLQQNNKAKPKYGPYESQGLGTVVESLTSNGEELEQTLDNTVMRVKLNKPLPPNSSMQFAIKFKTYFDTGSVRRRMKVYPAWGFKHYNLVHWYPRIAVYDSKFGWTTDQHLGREFYSDFGTYDVELTMASNFVVEGTGFLQNRDEVLPDSLRQKLDISNFANKPWGEKPSIITPYDSTQRKTWKYHAENVHNVAYTADPTYRIGEADCDGIRCIALVQEPHAGRWQEVAGFTADVIRIYNRDFGRYAYPKMVVADAADGMEYPMLTLCGGAYPSNKGLVAHEVGHNWFYGMIGNNETYRAALDEGFTQFLTAWSLDALDGKYVEPQRKYKTKYQQRFSEPEEIKNVRVYDGYIWDAVDGEDAFLNTHSDAFNGALGHGGGYRHVYYKTATMLYNLQYVLGDTLFQDAMRHYFAQYSMAHPYFDDLRKSFTQYTGNDLNWFFDEWLETMKNIDYSVQRVKKKSTESDGSSTYDITFKRIGRMQMPIDFSVVLDNGDTLDYYIPNTWFQKKTNAVILPKWHGWDKLNPTYTATITVPGKVKNVIIDRTQRLADVNMLNNSKKAPIDFAFDSQVYTRPDWRTYEMNMRPDLWWNALDGIKLGVHLNGNYLNYRHIFDLSVFGTLGSLGQGSPSRFNFPESASDNWDKVGFILNYRTRLDHFVQDFEAYYHGQYMDGLEMHQLGLRKWYGNSNFYLYMKLMTRPQAEKVYHALYPGEWVGEKINNSLNLRWVQKYNYKHGNGSLDVLLRSAAIATDFSYHFLELTELNNTKFWRLELHTRVYGRYGTGKNPAPESMLYLAGANGEELSDNPFTRTIGYVPPGWVGSYGTSVNHFQMGGGLNLRGYSGYAVVEKVNGRTFYAYKGNSGAAINAELDLDGIVKWKPKWISDHFHLDVYLFGDAGILAFTANGKQEFTEPRLDAGTGFMLTIKNWGPLSKIKPLEIRFDIPFYISHAPAAEPDNIKFRWVVGLHRSF